MKRELKPRLPRSQLSILPSHGSIYFYTYYTIFIYTILYYINILYIYIYMFISIYLWLAFLLTICLQHKHTNTHTPILLAKNTCICLQLAHPGEGGIKHDKDLVAHTFLSDLVHRAPRKPRLCSSLLVLRNRIWWNPVIMTLVLYTHS